MVEEEQINVPSFTAYEEIEISRTHIQSCTIDDYRYAIEPIDWHFFNRF